MSARDEIHRLVDELPEELTNRVLAFVVSIGASPGRATDGLSAEDRAWLDADLSNLASEAPFDWGPEGVPAGTPIIWDEQLGAFMVEVGDDEA